MTAGALSPLQLLTDVAARGALALRRSLLAAADAVVPPELALFEQAIGVARTQLLHAVARLGMADRLAGGPRSAEELAREAGVDAGVLHRALRALASFGVFRLRRDGRFENGRLSRALRASAPGSMRDLLDYLGSAANLGAWGGLDRALETGRSAFRAVHGGSVWEWFARHPDDERTFAAAMVHVSELEAPFLASGYDWGRIRRVCDVGGGHGALLAALLVRHPRMRGVLLDAPQVVSAARPRLAAQGLADRVECVGGDMREAVPGGCDVYLLKDVLHDWDDATGIRILEACRRAAPAGARVVVCEMTVGRGEARAPATLVDLQMLVATEEGRQRTATELQELLRRAGLRPRRVVRIAGLLSLVEAVAPAVDRGVRPPSRAPRAEAPPRSRRGPAGANARGGARSTRRRPARPRG